MALPNLYNTVSINAEKIDQMGILQATFAAMVAAANGLCDQFVAAQIPWPCACAC